MELLSTFSNCKQWWDQTPGKKKYPLTALFLLVLGFFIVSLLANQQVGLLKKAVTAHTELKTLPLIISSAALGILLLGIGIAYHRREKALEQPKAALPALPPPPARPDPKAPPQIFNELRRSVAPGVVSMVQEIEPPEAAEAVAQRIIDGRKLHPNAYDFSGLGISSLPETFFDHFLRDTPINLKNNPLLSCMPRSYYSRPGLEYDPKLFCITEIKNFIEGCAVFGEDFDFLKDLDLEQLQTRFSLNGASEVLKFFFSKDLYEKGLQQTKEYRNHPQKMDLRIAKLLYGLSQKQEFFDQAVEYLQTREEACGDEKLVSLSALEGIHYMVYEAPNASADVLARYLVGRGRELLLARKAMEYASKVGDKDEELEYLLFFKQRGQDVLKLPIEKIHRMDHADYVLDVHGIKEDADKIIENILNLTKTPEAQCALLLGTADWQEILDDADYSDVDLIVLEHQLKTFQRMWKKRIEQDYGHKVDQFNKKFEAFSMAVDDDLSKAEIVASLQETPFIVDGKTPKGIPIKDLLQDLSQESRDALVAEVNEFIGEGPKMLRKAITLAILRGENPELI